MVLFWFWYFTAFSFSPPVLPLLKIPGSYRHGSAEWILHI